MKVDLAGLEPAPTAMVANLPYSVATPLILRTIAELPSVGRWTVMVQREIAERLRARPGSRSYGSPSVMVQLSCDVRMLRAVDPAVFTPRPRVDSAVLALRRRGTRLIPATTAQLIRDSFAHRRKALPKSMELAVKRREAEAEKQGLPAPRPRSAEVRHLSREALRALGTARGDPGGDAHPRAAPDPGRGDRRGARVIVAAPAKLNLCLYVGPVREDGLHEICSLFAPLGLFDRLEISASGRGRGRRPGVARPGPRPDRASTDRAA